MKEENIYINKQDYRLSYIQENIELVIYATLAFFVPFFLSHPQYVVGSVVNAALILAAFNLKFQKTLPVILLPSLGVLISGLIFGKFTIFLVYMIPFIWIGNSILVFGIKYLNLKHKLNKVLSITISGIIKTVFLFTSAFILVNLKILPPPFLVAMGLFQLYTVLIGGTGAIIIQKLKKNLF